MRRLKIVSDGTVNGTNVVDADTGEPVSYVQKVCFHADVGSGVCNAEITVAKIPFEFTGEAETKEVKVG